MKDKEHTSRNVFHGMKVLVMGLGLHGGGVATVRWLCRHGAAVTVTDLRDKKTLAPSLRVLKGLQIRFVLGKHRTADFRAHDIIVVGPGVRRESPYLLTAKKAGKTFENDASLFFRFLQNPIIAVTGTRGKTTTTLWIAELLKKKYPAVRQSGTPENAELNEFERIKNKHIPAVVELSSWQLEYLPRSGKAPYIAAITNIYPEHLNRYRDIKAYADAKANIFLHQHANDMLVLNYDDPWHRYFLKKKPKSALYYISTKVLPKKLEGIYVKNDQLVLRVAEQGSTLLKDSSLFSVTRFRNEYGEHNLENLLRAVLMAKLFEPTVKMIERDALTLPTPHMRQEIIYKKRKLTVVNDSCATSPDGTIAALRRFSKGRNLVLIAGGTDKELEFAGLAKEIKKHISKKQLILLEGSATTKLIAALRKCKYFDPHEPLEYLNLASCVTEAFRIVHGADGNRGPTLGIKKGRSSVPAVILFSPGAASFEKFLHEFDRGEEFNKLVKKNATSLTS